MPNTGRLSHRVRWSDFSWGEARNDLPNILNSLAEPHRHPTFFMSIAGRHTSEALSLTQYEEMSRPPLQSTEFEHLFRPFACLFVKLTVAEVSFASKYLAAIRPKIVREARKNGRSVCDHLFLTHDGTPITLAAFRKAFRRARNAVTAQPFSPGRIRGLLLCGVSAKLAETEREFAGIPWLKKNHLTEIERIRFQLRIQDQTYTSLLKHLGEAFGSSENQLDIR